VHNEYLQVLAELEMVGLALLLALLAAVARMVWRGRDLVGTPATWAGVVAGLSALAVHSGLGCLWHLLLMPACAMSRYPTRTPAAVSGHVLAPHPPSCGS
jgi:O-antigen ligase